MSATSPGPVITVRADGTVSGLDEARAYVLESPTRRAAFGALLHECQTLCLTAAPSATRAPDSPATFIAPGAEAASTAPSTPKAKPKRRSKTNSPAANLGA